MIAAADAANATNAADAANAANAANAAKAANSANFAFLRSSSEKKVSKVFSFETENRKSAEPVSKSVPEAECGKVTLKLSLQIFSVHQL